MYFHSLAEKERTVKVLPLESEKHQNRTHNMQLPWKQNGMTYGYDADGERFCAGAKMGRPNILPADYNSEKLSLRRVPFVDGAYDQGGAYWGSPANLRSADLSGANLRSANLAESQGIKYSLAAFTGHGERGRMLSLVEVDGKPVFFCGCFKGSPDELAAYIEAGPNKYKPSRKLAMNFCLEAFRLDTVKI